MGGESNSNGNDKDKKELGISPGRAKAQFGKATLAGKTVGQAKDLTSGVASTSAKQEEFTGPGSKYTGTANLRPGKTRGASPGDVNAIVGSYQSEDYKAKLSGVAGINAKNLGQLQQRAQVGQLDTSIDTPIGKIPAGITSIGLNVVGKKMAQTIMDDIAAGDRAVFSTRGDIVGSVGKSFLGMDVYTGRVGYNPLGRKSGVKRIGSGYMLGMEAPSSDGGGQDRATSPAAAPSEPSEPVSAPSTGLSSAAKKSLQAARTAGAARRRFIV